MCVRVIFKEKRRRSSWQAKMERRRRKGMMTASAAVQSIDDDTMDSAGPPVGYPSRQKRNSWWNIFVPDNIKQRWLLLKHTYASIHWKSIKHVTYVFIQIFLPYEYKYCIKWVVRHFPQNTKHFKTQLMHANNTLTDWMTYAHTHWIGSNVSFDAVRIFDHAIHALCGGRICLL